MRGHICVAFENARILNCYKLRAFILLLTLSLPNFLVSLDNYLDVDDQNGFSCPI